MTANITLLDRHKAVLPKWMALYYQEPIALVRGEGRRVWDQVDRSYLDFFGGILTTMTGYNVPEVVEAIRDQAGKMIHSSTLYLIESQIELAEKLAELSGIPNAKVFFTNSGSEANDAALMLATAYRRSNQVLAMRHSYHGRSFATVPVTGIASWSPTSLSPFTVHYVHGSYRFRSPFRHLDDQAYIEACTEDLINICETAVSGDLACLIAEPILGVGGFAHGPDGLFKRFHEELAKRGALFISDEVQTGWGRTGEHFWGYQAHDIVPDMLTFAKGLGNGLALGGVIGRGDVIDCFQASSISTFGGNPLATRGALANLGVLFDQKLQENSALTGAKLMDSIKAAQAQNPHLGEIRGKGLMIGIEITKADGKSPDRDRARAILENAKAQGLLIGIGGFYGNAIRLTPPMSVTLDECDEALAILHRCFASH